MQSLRQKLVNYEYTYIVFTMFFYLDSEITQHKTPTLGTLEVIYNPYLEAPALLTAVIWSPRIWTS